jgi:antirestriction protein ArdC
MKDRRAETRFDIHQHVTNQIVAAIEAGAGEFRLPWHRAAGSIMRPVNVASKKPYQGVNVLTLWAAGDAAGYEAGTWGTYKQWAEAGAQVRKGEKASYIVFYKEITVASEEANEDDSGTRLFARATPVFAAEQVDGYASPALPEPPTNPIEPIERAEAFIAATGATIVHGGGRACYVPRTDNIHMPCLDRFRDAEAYTSTKLHELTHWSGIETRCNRQFGKRFGDDAYAMEELVAELGAAFLCADLGITDATRADHAQYLDNWLRVLKADKKAIFTAASKASQAAAFLAGLQPA